MSKEKSESNKKQDAYKKEMEQVRAKEIEALSKLQQSHTTLKPEPVERSVKLEGKKHTNQIYLDWLKNYKKKNPGFKEDENDSQIDEHGHCCIHFSDPQAEEDFVRYLAVNSSYEGITDKGILIARFEEGKLIDPRTNEEFPEGEYAGLVQQLDSGIAYSDISMPKSPTPFKKTPY